MKAIKPGSKGTTIGWIGTGVMGSSMCMRLVKKGYKTSVYNRTKKKAAGLIKEGAEWLGSPREVAARSDVVFTIVGFPADVRQV